VVALLALIAALLPRWRRRDPPDGGDDGGRGPARELTATQTPRPEHDLARYDV
jgi:hypothetical protein